MVVSRKLRTFSSKTLKPDLNLKPALNPLKFNNLPTLVTTPKKNLTSTNNLIGMKVSAAQLLLECMLLSYMHAKLHDIRIILLLP
jgi:hypothetical protein